MARWSAIALHLIQLVYGTMIRAAPDVDSARAVVDQATAALGQEDSCTFCSVMLAVPAAAACADAGDLNDARHHLRAAERSAALWKGTAEAQAHLHRTEGDAGTAHRRLIEAAELFTAASYPSPRSSRTTPTPPITKTSNRPTRTHSPWIVSRCRTGSKDLGKKAAGRCRAIR